uniref:Glycolipid transfer protein domain-containing protein n=1 Tax=Chenopodium quinoa TaxID=63459 RepID=A0A803NEB7_CHEQI
MEGTQGSVFTPALEGIKLVKSEDGEMLTRPFLDACKHILPVIDKFGAAMTLVKSDIGGNITVNTYLVVHFQVTRVDHYDRLVTFEAMDFLVELFRNLLEHPDWSMSQACTDSYGKTLKKWHGWLASSSFSIAMKLAPDRNKFMEVLGGDAVKCDIEQFLTTFNPLLQQNHKFLVR